MRPSRQRSCQSFTAAACASASTALSSRSRGVPSSTVREAPRDDSGGGVVPAASGATAVFVTAGPVATDPDKDAAAALGDAIYTRLLSIRARQAINDRISGQKTAQHSYDKMKERVNRAGLDFFRGIERCRDSD